MKKIGDLFQDLGFNKDAPIETQKAFFRHLVAKAYPPLPINKSNLENIEEKKESVTETSTQLSFDPKILGLVAK